MTSVIKVTKKGQATIPKRFRRRFGIEDRVVFTETAQGLLVRPAPKPEDDYGSLKGLFGTKTAKELLAQARAPDIAREARLLRRRRK
jgi:AbrB family looped-hinge helix DNA binding protein